MNNGKRHRVVAFGRFKMDLTDRLLLRDGEPVSIAPKLFDTLSVLVENAGHLVQKDELMDRLWKGTFVEESSLSQNIFQLRKILTNGTPGWTYIETIPKRGYRFAANVVEAIDPDFDRLPETLPRLDIRSIAVMPFTILGDPESDFPYLGLGMADAVIVRLGSLRGVRVMPTRTMLKYAGRSEDLRTIAREHGIGAVIEGAIQRNAGQVRVTVQLYEAETGRCLWSGKFDEKWTDVLAMQDAVSEHIADALAPEFSVEASPKKDTESMLARQSYLTGFFFSNKRTRESLSKAIGYFHDAISFDSRYARAHAGLADAHFWRAYSEKSPELREESFELSRKHALAAIELDSSVAEAHAALATVQVKHDRDTAAADRSFKRAVNADPTCAMAFSRYTYFLAAVGRLDEALETSTRAQELDPLSPDANASLGLVLYFLRRYDAATRYCRLALDLEPTFSEAALLLGRCYEQKGMFDEAEVQYAEASRLEPNLIEADELRAYLHAVTGRKTLAKEELVKLSRCDRAKPFNIAAIYCALGDNKQASAWLHRPFINWTERLRMVRYDPRLDPCRRVIEFH